MLLVATEDALSEAVALRLLREAHPTLGDIRTMGGRGNGYLRRRLPEFCRTARRCWVLLLTDLDRVSCPGELIRSWFGGHPQPEKLVVRVAVREIEAWLLADRWGLGSFLEISESRITTDPQDLSDPKAYLVQLARSGRRDARRDICPAKNARAPQGLGYNNRLRQFVEGGWSPDRAANLCDSLARARRSIANMVIKADAAQPEQ